MFVQIEEGRKCNAFFSNLIISQNLSDEISRKSVNTAQLVQRVLIIFDSQCVKILDLSCHFDFLPVPFGKDFFFV